MNEVHVKLGKLLKLERERKGVQLADLSESLKISEENLTHIETGESHKLPAPLYFKLFSRAYAEALGIDYEATMLAIQEDIAEQNAAAQPPEKEKARKAAEEARRVEEAKYGFRKKLIWLFGGIIATAIAFFLIYSMLIQAPERSTGGESGDAAAPVESVNEALAEYDFGEPPEAAPGPIKMTLRAREESWATILADGDTVIFRSLVPWRVYEVEATNRIVASVAHPRLVDITLNGEAVDLRDPESRRISRVEVDQVNLPSMLQRKVDESEPEPAPARRQAQPTTTPQQPSQPEQPAQTPSRSQDTARQTTPRATPASTTTPDTTRDSAANAEQEP
ncbi:DUF4115 domain-containing protein [bacterium]|nr:DUF4115 domain-containing protein [bacterium]